MPPSTLLDRLARTVPVTILLLDACRTDIFPAAQTILLPGSETAIAIAPAGLGEMRGPTPVARAATPAESLGMVIGFAASPGRAALDGLPGGNSPYASALLKHLGTDGYSFGDLMTMVTEEVYLKTGAQQLPWVNSSLRRVLSFGAPATAVDVDEAAIRAGRRALLLSIDALPDFTRRQVEAQAARSGVPMDGLYGLLAALGAEIPEDPAALEQLLAAQAERLGSILAEQATLMTSDAEIQRLAGLAERALAEGALDANVRFWEAAKARYAEISQTLDMTEANLMARRLEGGAVLARTAEAYALRSDYQMAAENYAAAFAEVARWDDGRALNYKWGEANALREYGDRKGGNVALLASIAAYGEALALAPRAENPADWASLQNYLGTALRMLGVREGNTARVAAAVTAHLAALDALARDHAPLDWAQTQNNLGSALQALGGREGSAERLEEAAVAYRAALEELTRARAPARWARVQNNLGLVLQMLGEREPGTARLQEAVVAYRAALEELTRERAPLDWAQVQNNLGNAFQMLGGRESGTALLEEAVVAYRAALEERTRERMPFE